MTDTKHNEEFRLSGDEVKEKVREVIKEGNARKIIIKNQNKKTILEIPLTFGVIGAVIAPVLAAVSAVAAIVTDCTVVVVKKDEDEEVQTHGKTQ